MSEYPEQRGLGKQESPEHRKARREARKRLATAMQEAIEAGVTNQSIMQLVEELKLGFPYKAGV